MSIELDQIGSITEDYGIKNENQVTLGVLGSHSALEIGYGARQENLDTLVVCERGRETTYTDHYENLFDHLILVDQFKDMAEPAIQEKMRDLCTIFVPNRSFATYVGYDRIENGFSIPILGNRMMLRAEERYEANNQYDLLDSAGITRPKELNSPEEINSLSIIKVHEKDRTVERAFFYASSYEEYKKRAENNM